MCKGKGVLIFTLSDEFDMVEQLNKDMDKPYYQKYKIQKQQTEKELSRK